jgi:hypothetical protein
MLRRVVAVEWQRFGRVHRSSTEWKAPGRAEFPSAPAPMPAWSGMARAYLTSLASH